MPGRRIQYANLPEIHGSIAQSLSRLFRLRREMEEVIAVGRVALAESRELLTKADDVLAKR